jgi:hypothetical protein
MLGPDRLDEVGIDVVPRLEGGPDMLAESLVMLHTVDFAGPPGEPYGAGTRAKLEDPCRALTRREPGVDNIDRVVGPPGNIQLSDRQRVVDLHQAVGPVAQPLPPR